MLIVLCHIFGPYIPKKLVGCFDFGEQNIAEPLQGRPLAELADHLGKLASRGEAFGQRLKSGREHRHGGGLAWKTLAQQLGERLVGSGHQLRFMVKAPTFHCFADLAVEVWSDKFFPHPPNVEELGRAGGLEGLVGHNRMIILG